MKLKKPYIDRASSTLVTEQETLSLTKLNIVFTQQDFERLINADNITLFTCSYNTEKYELLCPLDKAKFMAE